MRPASTLGRVAALMLSISPIVAAWPHQLLPRMEALIARQTNDAPEAEQTADPTETGSESEPETTTAPPAGDNTASPDDQDSDEEDASSGSRGNSTTTAREDFDPRSPAGEVNFLTPGPFADLQLYKIGDDITWVWNYTNLLATPTAIDVMVSNTIVSETITLTQNMTFEETVSFTWRSSTQKTPELLTEKYILIIYDAEAGPDATPEPGYLKKSDSHTFGLYEPRDYTPLSDFICATCSRASAIDHHALGFAVGICAVTVASFTWFVTGLHVLW